VRGLFSGHGGEKGEADGARDGQPQLLALIESPLLGCAPQDWQVVPEGT
jgi:hypothetical protein